MVLHLVLSKQIDGLMFHLISKQEMSSAADLVSLFHLERGALNPEVDEIKLIEVMQLFTLFLFFKCIYLFILIDRITSMNTQ